MAHATTILAGTSWPDAAVAISGVALVGSVAVIIIWQALATWRARMTAAKDEAYRRLAEQTARDLREIAAHLAGDDRPADR